MTVCEEIYPEKSWLIGDSHTLFLKNLKRVLPKDRDAIIIADALSLHYPEQR